MSRLLKNPRLLSRKAARPSNGKADARVVASGDREVTFGFPEFWPTVHDLLPAFFAAGTPLMDLTNESLRRPVSGKLAKVTHFILATTANAFGALILLAANGYGHAAMQIARGMFESCVNARYLKKNPPDVDDFLGFYWIRKKRIHEYLSTYSPLMLSAVPSQQVTQILEESAKVAPRYQNAQGRLRSTWCKKNLRQMATEVGLEQYYPTFYASASDITHGNIHGIITQSTKDALSIDPAPSLESVEDALRMGHTMLLAVLECLNDVARLALDNKIQVALDECVNAWQLRQPEATETRE